MSSLALQLHLCSAIASAFTELPGFVPDAFLAAIVDDIALAIIELTITGVWQRNGDGYQIPDRQLRTAIRLLTET